MVEKRERESKARKYTMASVEEIQPLIIDVFIEIISKARIIFSSCAQKIKNYMESEMTLNIFSP